MENTTNTYPDELQHWGIKGMKWGIRRFQNKDGSLTPAGRKRYDDEPDDGGQSQAQPKKAHHEMTGKDYKKLKLEDMTDEDLAYAINRSRAEQTYKQLNPEPVSKGKQLAEKFFNDALIPVAVNAGKNFMDKQMNKIIDKALKDAVPKTELETLKEAAEILKVKKDIADYKDQLSKVGKEKEKSWSEQKRELEDKIAVSKLQDEDYQARKKASELADMQNKINKVKDGGTFDVDDNGDIKANPSTTKPKNEQKKNDANGSDSKPKADNNDSNSKPKSEPKSEEKVEKASGEVVGEGKSTSKIKQEMDYKEEARATLQRQMEQARINRERTERYLDAMDKLYPNHAKSDTDENRGNLMSSKQRRVDEGEAIYNKLKAVFKDGGPIFRD